ncbi:hypothetical protein [Massilia varians]|jgi:hypothetical protein|uniref:hypothetical protein n=1 Tax=Massilia TaxID=149698 RepID=UPI0025554979|nr:hypothetical protein [Massilia varians]MDK6076254.1 hypothetical protein [Massilia varians]
MSTKQNKTPVDYFEYADDGRSPFIVLQHRQGRLPVQRTVVTAAGVVEITGADGVIEVLGSNEHPCSVSVLQRIRTHHEGLLLVDVDPSRINGVREQVLTARFV